MKALSYPFHIDNNGRVATTDSYAEIVKAHLVDAIMTNFHERVMRPDYGCNVQAALFDPSNELVRSDASQTVMQRVQQWAPRVVMRDIQFETDPTRGGAVFMRVSYQAGTFDEARTLHLPTSTFMSEETPV